MAKHKIMQTTPYDSPGSLVLSRQNSLSEIPTASPPTGAPNKGGMSLD